jgi:hypothetical protein
MEYLLKDNQRVVDFLEAGTQEDTQRFNGLIYYATAWKITKDIIWHGV